MIYSIFHTYILFAAKTIVPLLALPIIAAMVGVEGLGAILAAQSLGLIGGLFIQFGFHQTASRQLGLEIAESGRSRIVASVLSSQVATTVFAVAFVSFAAHHTAAIAELPFGVLSTVLLAVGTGLSPAWYFRGTGRASLGVAFELFGQLAAILLIFLFVYDPYDTWSVIFIFGFSQLFFSIVGIVVIFSENARLPFVGIGEIIRQLRGSFAIFLVRGSSTGFTMGAAWIASLLTTSRETAYFGVAAKIAAALTAFSQPVLFSLLPVISRKATKSRRDALREASRWGAALVVLGLGAAVGVQIFADLFIGLLFAPDMAPAADVTRMLAWICVVAAFRDTLGDLVLVPLHRDKTVAACVMAGSGLGVAMAFWLAPVHGADGMVWARIGGEMVIVLLMTVALAAFVLSSKGPSGSGERGGTPPG